MTDMKSLHARMSLAELCWEHRLEGKKIAHGRKGGGGGDMKCAGMNSKCRDAAG